MQKKARIYIRVIFEDPTTTRHRDDIESIIVPVIMIVGWNIYFTSRKSHTYSVIRMLEKRRVKNQMADSATGMDKRHDTCTGKRIHDEDYSPLQNHYPVHSEEKC